MKNTSLGVHTFAFYQKLDEDSFSSLEDDFISYMKKTGAIARYPIENNGINIGWEYTYN